MLIDVSMPIAAGSVFRLGTPPVEIATNRYHHESEGDYETVMLRLPAHTATHVDLVFPERRMDPSRMISPGRLVDVTGVVDREIELGDVEPHVDVQAGESLFFRTDWSEFAGTARYYEHPELSRELVEWLAEKRVNAVGIDALGLGRDRRHGEYDRLLAAADVLVLENLAHLRAIPRNEFTVYCLPLSLEGVDAVPARVLVGVDRGG
jgi:kynurenine formamidase